MSASRAVSEGVNRSLRQFKEQSLSLALCQNNTVSKERAWMSKVSSAGMGGWFLEKGGVGADFSLEQEGLSFLSWEGVAMFWGHRISKIGLLR